MKTFVFILCLLGISFSSFAKKAQYKIDPAHSSVVFKIDHMGFSSVYGSFEDVSGSVQTDDKSMMEVDVKIKADSVDTNNQKRDEHLRSPDFFNAKQFPMIHFKGSRLKKVSADKFEISGILEMHGKKKEITIPFERHRTGKDPWGKTRTGISTEFKVKRSDFDMEYMLGENKLGDEVHIFLSLEAILE